MFSLLFHVISIDVRVSESNFYVLQYNSLLHWCSLIEECDVSDQLHYGLLSTEYWCK
jgi:hypothetical protein